MKVFLFDVSRIDPHVVETKGGLAEWRKLLKCDLIDITRRKIGGRYFDVILDDEALLKAGAKVSAIDPDQKPALVGNLIVCNSDEEGNETTLTDEDILHIMRNTTILISEEGKQPDVWPALKNVSC